MISDFVDKRILIVLLLLLTIMPPSKSLIAVERIEKLIYLIRDHRVMIDSDLAELYGVTTGALNQALKRNIDRFPEDFVFNSAQKNLQL